MAFSGCAKSEDRHYEPVSDAYRGKSIFVTGGSGFLGKVFLEKILYRCPEVEKIYVLLRETDSASSEQRLKKMMECPLFKTLKEERPQDLEKCIPIIGDISKPKLGINPEDEIILLENVSMVFHFAATVKFNEPLEDALNINVEGTRRVLDLCVKMKKIELFLHISTAFSNPHVKEVDEIVYPPVVPHDRVDKWIEEKTFTSEEIKKVTDSFPNTYVLTKNITEDVVVKFHETERIPTVIIRPSIVISSKDGPVSGWIENWYGPTFLVVMIGRGVIRVLLGARSNIIDLIPVDYVANLITVAAARRLRDKTIEVYNIVSSDANPMTLGKLGDMIIDNSSKNKTGVLPIPSLIFVKRRWLMITLIFLLETIPAYLLTFCQLLRIFGKKQNYFKILSKVDEVRTALDPFTSRTWIMKSRNTSALLESLSSNDRRIFPCDITTVDWNEYIPVYFRGIEKYLIGTKNK